MSAGWARSGLLAAAIALATPSIAHAQVCYRLPFSNPTLWDGWGSTYGRMNPHRGVDFPQATGTPVPAVADGVVRINTWNTCLGWAVVIQHPDGMHSGYSHLVRQSHLPVGARVRMGNTIGYVGNTGSCSRGAHLHLTISYAAEGYAYGWYATATVDPIPYIRARETCRRDRDGDGSPEGEDCDDTNPARRPGRAESCDNQDNDCDRRVDEGLARACGSNVGECRAGTQRCASGRWGSCDGEIPPADELCDGLDNDCDAAVDDERICEHDAARLASQSFAGRTSTDIDGDGSADVCMRSTTGVQCLLTEPVGFTRLVPGPALDLDGWDDPRRYSSIRMADVDGDGRDDVCARRGDAIECWHATAAGFGASTVELPLSAPSPEARFAEVWLADVDGDGRADVCARGEAGLRCHASAASVLWSLPALADAEGFADVRYHGSIRFGDINGDGRDDVCARKASGVRCWTAGPHGFDHTVVGPSWSDDSGWGGTEHWSTIRLADVDGDGRADVCGSGPRGLACHLSSGFGFDAARTVPSLPADDGADRAIYSTLRAGDIDGDGGAELCARSASGLSCWSWGNESFARSIPLGALSDEAGWDDAPRYESLQLADVNGDARADVCGRGPSGVRCWLSSGTHFDRLWASDTWSEPVLDTAPYLSSFRVGTPAPGLSAVPPPGPRPLPPDETVMTGGCAATGHGAGGAFVLTPWLALVLALRRRGSRRSRLSARSPPASSIPTRRTIHARCRSGRAGLVAGLVDAAGVDVVRRVVLEASDEVVEQVRVDRVAVGRPFAQSELSGQLVVRGEDVPNIVEVDLDAAVADEPAGSATLIEDVGNAFVVDEVDGGAARVL